MDADLGLSLAPLIERAPAPVPANPDALDAEGHAAYARLTAAAADEADDWSVWHVAEDDRFGTRVHDRICPSIKLWRDVDRRQAVSNFWIDLHSWFPLCGYIVSDPAIVQLQHIT